MAIQEPLRHERAGKIRQVGALLELFSGFFSEAGTWSAAEISGWYRGAGLEALKPRSPSMAPDPALHPRRPATRSLPGAP